MMHGSSQRAASYACLATLGLFGFVAVSAASAQDLVITDVTTIDPPSGMVRAHQTVVIDDGVIQTITDHLSEGAQPEAVVDGSGRFLIPGLWDMHVHLSMHSETDLVMLVVNGVLNARDMGGDPFAAADLERRIAADRLVGPNLWYAGSMLEDRRWLDRARSTYPSLRHRLPVDNPEEARAMVALLDSWGVDLVKVRNVRDVASLRATLAAAEEHGLTVAGHEPVVVDIDQAARLGMTTFEHLPFLSLTLPGKEAGDERVARVIAALDESGSFLCPTMIASTMLGEPRDVRAAAIERPDPRYEYLSEKAREQWLESLEADAGPLPWEQMRKRSIELIRQMHEAGIPLLAGTDMGVPLTFPGFALHDELELMVERTSISPLAALRAASSHPAELFAVAAGSIAPGMPADLVLLDEDPLLDISNTRTIEAVVLRGELLDGDELDALSEWVREHKDEEPETELYDRMVAACRAAETPECLERLAGYQFSLFRYAEARATYQRALDAGAGGMALEGLFSSAINLLHADQIECTAAAAAAEKTLARHPNEPNKLVGVLDRFLAQATARCPAETETFLTRLAALDEQALDDEMRPIYRAHYAAFLATVEDDEAAAYDYRIARMPEGWRDDVAQLQEVATWCLKQGLALDRGRELARRAKGIAPDPIGRLESMMLEARLASAAGDHRDAVELMTIIDAAVPDNETVQGLLETFRHLATEAGSRSDG